LLTAVSCRSLGVSAPMTQFQLSVECFPCLVIVRAIGLILE
jgi:hypothetical protein